MPAKWVRHSLTAEGLLPKHVHANAQFIFNLKRKAATMKPGNELPWERISSMEVDLSCEADYEALGNYARTIMAENAETDQVRIPCHARLT
jgi:hypothetical protein